MLWLQTGLHTRGLIPNPEDLKQSSAKVLKVHHKSFLCFCCEHRIPKLWSRLYYLFFSTGGTYCFYDYSLYLYSTEKQLLWGYWKSLWKVQEITDWSQNGLNSIVSFLLFVCVRGVPNTVQYTGLLYELMFFLKEKVVEWLAPHVFAKSISIYDIYTPNIVKMRFVKNAH